MFNPTAVVIDAFVNELRKGYVSTYTTLEPDYPGIIDYVGHMALELIANSDAPYHDLGHTICVTLVGQEVLRGKFIREGGISPRDWLHFIISLLCHDIGYVRGICLADRQGHFCDRQRQGDSGAAGGRNRRVADAGNRHHTLQKKATRRSLDLGKVAEAYLNSSFQDPRQEALRTSQAVNLGNYHRGTVRPTHRQCARALNDEGVPTPSGEGTWTAATVARLRQRLEPQLLSSQQYRQHLDA